MPLGVLRPTQTTCRYYDKAIASGLGGQASRKPAARESALTFVADDRFLPTEGCTAAFRDDRFTAIGKIMADCEEGFKDPPCILYAVDRVVPGRADRGFQISISRPISTTWSQRSWR